RNAERESIINSIVIDFADIVIDSRGAKHRSGDAGIYGEISGQHAGSLGAREENLVLAEESFVFVDEAREIIHELLRLLEPSAGKIDAATTEAHIVAHHASAGERLEQIKDFLPLTERIHQRRAAGAHILDQKTDQRSVILQAR